MLPFDLHVLGLPPAFTLSQDQTLHLKFSIRPKSHLMLRVQMSFLSFELLTSICMLLNLSCSF